MRSDGVPGSLHHNGCDASCLPELRQWLRTNLPADDDVGIDAELVCTELVTNAIEHGRGAAEVRIHVQDDQVRIEVDDHNTAALPAMRTPTPDDYRGRGLTVIDAIATWGTMQHPTGKTVWALVQAHR